jgi:hypothetical protein
VLLDSAASGVNTVEREGVSIRHPAKFVLIGSGNPEEGDLRPQLLDRFGMYAEINTIKDPLQGGARTRGVLACDCIRICVRQAGVLRGVGGWQCLKEMLVRVNEDECEGE